jgi:demethylmenaquinone methyltransferase/2-methoxy-6-polyprenyl-1,4-benzoquinol methylase
MIALKHDTIRPYGHTDTTKKEEVEHMFDNIAHRYDFLNHLLSAGIDHTWRKKAVNYIGEIHPKIIADLATGTGDFAMESARLNPTKIIGIDISDEMMHYGRIKTKNKKYDFIEFIKGDSEKLEFDDNYFDAMTVGFGVRNYQNLEQGLTEMKRILRTNGRLVILEVSIPKNTLMKFIFNIYFNYFCPFIGRLFSKDVRAYTYLNESVNAFPSGKNFTDILEKIGFRNVVWKPLTFGICAMYTCEK